jgi:H+/Cl- antiporter ClcA
VWLIRGEGAAIGLNAAFLNIVTEWLSDIKRGYCTTAFYLNQNVCCFGAENGNFIVPCLNEGCADTGRL